MESFSNSLNNLKNILNKRASKSKILVQETTTPRYSFSMSQDCPKNSNLKLKILSTPCVKDPKYFDDVGTLIVKEDLGGFFKTPNHTYFFSKDVKTYDQGYATCCKLGMELVEFNSQKKLLELLNPIRAIQKRPIMLWTSGRGKNGKQTCYWWITKNTLMGPDTMWLKDEPIPPINSECGIVLYIATDISGFFAVLPDFKALFMCQRYQALTHQYQQTTPHFDVLMPDISGDVNMKIKSPIPNIDYLTSNNKIYFKLKSKQGVYPVGLKQMSKLCSDMQLQFTKDETDKKITLSPDDGVMKSVCGRQYMLSNTTNTKKYVYQNGAIQNCAELNMVPLIITTLEELKCLSKLHADWPERKGKTFYWLMGMDLNLNQNFTYCSQKIIPVSDDIWLPGNPSLYTGMENKIAFFVFSGGIGGLVDFPDVKTIPYICEPREQQLEKLKNL